MPRSQFYNPLATRGMITTPHYLASQAGLHILRSGGCAIEAAIAAAAVLTVVYPQMCTLGGDNFWLIYNAADKELKGLNASGRSGSQVTRTVYENLGLSQIPSRGPLAAITVPGVVSGWDKALGYAKEHGLARFSLDELLSDALVYAEEGFPVSKSLADWIVVDTDTQDTEQRCLQRYPGFAKLFLPEGRPLQACTRLRQPDLARSLRILMDQGAAAFYEGELAHALVRGLRDAGGLLTEEDFARHTADWVEPLSTPYRQYTACNLPPNTQGLSSLQILALAATLDMQALGEGSADYYHYLIEATKLAFADRERYVTDPAFVQAPLEHLLSQDYIHRQAARMDRSKAQSFASLLDPKGDTIWLGVVDGAGNAVSLIQSIYNDFGSGIVPEGTGILLQNRGSFFSLNPSHPNTLEPAKRTMHTLNPPMILENGRPRLIYGTMGGEGQPQTQAALVTRILDFGMTPQEAIDAPRWLYGRTWGASSNTVKLEARIDRAVAHDLEARGHVVEYVADYSDTMGHAGAILIDQESGILQGGTDPRSDGQALGY